MILDTDVLIDLKRKHPPALAWLATLPAPPLVCGLAAMELLFGSWDKREQAAVQKFMLLFPLAWPTEEDLQRAYVEYVPLTLATSIGLLDTMIATTAVGLGMPLATFNVKHYRHVPDLTTVQPYKR
jgi:hypothetical protein